MYKSPSSSKHLCVIQPNVLAIFAFLLYYSNSMYILCAGVVLGYNITHTTEFDYDHINSRFGKTEAITKMVSLMTLHMKTMCMCFY